MTNISEDRKVVLTALREVPYETTFLLSDATQDPSKPNRYWFDFPSQWSNQANKDPIVGIRSMYTTKTNRFILYDYKIVLFYLGPLEEEQDDDDDDLFEEQIRPTIQPAGEGIETRRDVDMITGTLVLWVDGSETIRPITENFNKYWKTPEPTTYTQNHTWKDWEIQAYYSYDRTEHKTYLNFGRGILENPRFTKTVAGVQYEYAYGIVITPKSDDAKALFGSNDPIIGIDKVKIPVWSRYQCLVKSSIADGDKNNILGHTRNDPYTPLKYYRLSHDLKRFWIELYETRFHDCPVVLPQDKRDDLIIEAVVAFSSQGML